MKKTTLESKALEHYNFLSLTGDLKTFLPNCHYDWEKDKKTFMIIFKEHEDLLSHTNDDLNTFIEPDEDFPYPL